MKKYNYVGWCMVGSLGFVRYVRTGCTTGKKATAYHLDND